MWKVLIPRSQLAHAGVAFSDARSTLGKIVFDGLSDTKSGFE